MAHAFKAHVRFLFIRVNSANDDRISGSSRIGVEAEGLIPRNVSPLVHCLLL